MPKRCVVGGCGNVADKERGITIHFIPYFGDERPEAKKRRKRWVDFVNLHRSKWSPTKYSVICSAHFKPDDYSRRFAHLGGDDQSNRWLKRDEFGVSVFPSVMPSTTASTDKHSGALGTQELSSRDKRKVS